MKSIILVAIMIAATTAINAQDNGNKGGEKAKLKIEQALSEMNLDEKKSEEVSEVLMTRRALIEPQNEIIKNAEESIKEAKKTIKQARLDADNQLKDLLTEEQIATLKELKKSDKKGAEKKKKD